MAQEPISILLLEPTVTSTASLAALLGRTSLVELLPVPTAAEAYQAALQFRPCVLVVSLTGPEDGSEQFELLQRLEKPIRSGQVKVFVVSAAAHHVLAQDIAALGAEYAEEPVTVRALMFKVNLALKAILAYRRQLETARLAEETIVIKSQATAPEKETRLESGGELRYRPALQLGEDIFVFRNSPPRKSGRKLVTHAEGPDPETGAWKAEGRGEGREAAWRWVPKPGFAQPAHDSGDGWICAGEPPEFNERTRKWQFRAEKPRLYFREKGKILAEKLGIDDDGKPFLTEDSETAVRNLAANRAAAARGRAPARAPRDPQNASLSSASTEPETAAKAARIHAGSSPATEGGESFVAVADPAEAQEPGEAEGSGSEKTREGKRERRPQPDPLAHEPVRPLRAEKKHREERERASGQEENESGASTREERDSAQDSEPSEQPSMGDDSREKAERRHALHAEAEQPEAEKGARAEPNENEENRHSAGSAAQAGESESANHAQEEPEQHEACELRRSEPSPGEDLRASRREQARRRAERRLRDLREEEERDEQAPDREPEPGSGEERRLRHELGLQDRPEITPRELAARAKQERREARRRQIEALEASLAGEGPSPEALFPEDSPPEAERSQREAGERKFRAIESIDPEHAEGFLGFGEGRSRGGSRAGSQEQAPPETTYHYLERTQVQPNDGSWENEEGAWLYVPSSIYERGFERLDDLLPAWLYRGGEEPALVEEGARWRFADSAPVLVSDASEIPKDLRDALESLRRQACFLLGIDPDANPRSAVEKEKKPASLHDRLLALAETLPAARAKQDPEPKTTPAIRSTPESESELRSENISPPEREAEPRTDAAETASPGGPMQAEKEADGVPESETKSEPAPTQPLSLADLFALARASDKRRGRNLPPPAGDRT